MEKLIGSPLRSMTERKPVSYEDVTLTPEEERHALHAAKIVKAQSINLSQYRDRMTEKVRYPVYTAQELYELKIRQANEMLSDKGIEFIVDDFNREIIQEMCFYFTSDCRCKWNLNKGIMLYGNTGSGKTFLMEMFAVNPRLTYRVFHVLQDVQSRAMQDGDEGLEPFTRLLNNTAFYTEFGQHQCGAMFDDLGTEDRSVTYFGTTQNVMRNIIERRYQNVPIAATHFTTNLTTEQIEERYGARVRSRLREMVNLIEFNPKAPDRRK